jgi:MFS family permease
MVVAFALMLGLAVAWTLGANPMRLADVRFRGSALVFGALGIQLAIYTPLTAHIPHTWDRPLHLGSYLMLIAFFLVNIRVPAFWLVGFGLLSNAAVIFANGGHMPITAEGWVATGGKLSDFNRHGISANSVLASSHTPLAWLGDIFALPVRVPSASVLSIGDLLIVLGTVAFIYRTCAPSAGPQSAHVLAPLRSAAFRRVIAGRLVSSVGDNLTQAAVVTWIYWSSRSVALVSAFLIVRMLASALGGLASAPLLDRIPAFTTLSVVETLRAGVACAMIPFAAAGHVWPVIGLGAVSSLLSAATSPTAQGLIPDVLPASQRQAGNAIHQMARSLTAVVGALIGGLAVVKFSIQGALAIDLVTFLIAAVLYRRYGRRPDSVAHHDADEAPRTSRRELARAILFNRVVFGLAASFTLVTGAVGILNSASSKVFDKQLGDAHAYGYILAVISVGYVCSEVLTGFMRRQSVARRSVGLSFIVTAGAMYVLSDSRTAPIAYLMLFLFGASDGITEVVRDSLIQLNTERRLRMGVFAMVNSVQTIGMVVGLALAPLIADRFATGQTLRVVAVGCLVSGVVAGVCLVGGGDADAMLDEDDQAEQSVPVVSGELGSPVPAIQLVGADGRSVTLARLAAPGPAVVVLAGRRRDDGSVEMLRELAGHLPAGSCLCVVSRRDSEVGKHAEAVRLATWLRDSSGECFRALRVVDRRRGRCGGVFVVDADGVLRFAFRLEKDGDWIPAGFVLSRLRRLAPAEPEVRVVRTDLHAAIEAIRPASEAA